MSKKETGKDLTEKQKKNTSQISHKVKTVKNGDSTARGRNSHGRFEKGNTFGNGRPVRPEIQELRNALAQVKEEKGISFLVNYIRRSYRDGAMSIALLRKLVPDLIAADFDIKPTLTDEETIANILKLAKHK